MYHYKTIALAIAIGLSASVSSAQEKGRGTDPIRKIADDTSQTGNPRQVAEALLSDLLADLGTKSRIEKLGPRFVRMWEKSAREGDGDAMYLTGRCYELGAGVQKDAEKAIEWYTKGHEAGNPFATFSLAFRYVEGGKFSRKSVALFESGATNNFAPAMLSLGRCYSDGEGVPKDEKAGVEWYLKAAKLGHTGAMINLGELIVTARVLQNRRSNRSSGSGRQPIWEIAVP